MPATPTPTPSDRSPLTEWRWLLPLVLVGLSLSIYPHLLAWAKTGSTAWIASFDEFECYLPLASNAWHNHPWFLADPWRETGGDSMFPWLQIIPATLAAKLLGTDPFGVCLVWRFWAGLSLPVGYFILIRRFVDSPAAAAGLVVLLLCAAGMIESRLDRHLIIWARIWGGVSGETFGSWPTLLHQFRLITPGLSWFFLFAFLWRFEVMVAMPTHRNILGGGLLLGLLIWLYFYFWTAVIVLLGCVWLTNRAARSPVFFATLLGTIAGAPSILLQRAAQQKYPHDWLERVDKFVPVDRFEHFYLPPVAIASLALATVLVWWRHRDLRHLWLLAVIGYGLINSQVITGLTIENMHWQYVMAPMVCLLVAILAYRETAARFGSRIWYRLAFGGLVAAYLMTGFQTRHWEVTRSRQPREINAALLAYRNERAELDRIPWEPRALVAGDDLFAGLVSWDRNLRPYRLGSGYSPTLSHDDMDERCALDDLLEGLEPEVALARATARYSDPGPGPWQYDSKTRQTRISRAHEAVRRIANNINGAAREAGIRYVALQRDSAAPDYLRSGWQKIHHGTHWQIWQEQRP